MALKVGDVAPDFEVPAVTGKEKSKLKLSDFRGKKNVVIAFYPWIGRRFERRKCQRTTMNLISSPVSMPRSWA